MANACLISFHKYVPSDRGTHIFLFDYFLLQFKKWAKYIDHLYIVDSGRGIDQTRINRLQEISKNLTVYSVESGSHWGNMNMAVPLIKEDKFLILDSDTIIYDGEIIKSIFLDLDKYDIVSMTDTSGWDELWIKYPFFRSNVNRSYRNRFTPYLFSAKTKLFKEIEPYDFSPDPPEFNDSMAKITMELMALDPIILEIPDDRSTLYYIDGKIVEHQFLDNSQYFWSRQGGKRYGYYHIRNWAGGHRLVESKALGLEDYKHHLQIMPSQEALRLLAWLYYTSDKVYHYDIFNVARDLIEEKQFYYYLEAFKEFYSWLEE